MVINHIPSNSTVSAFPGQNHDDYRVLTHPVDSASSIVDVVDDLLEVKYLIGNLQKNVNLIVESNLSDTAQAIARAINDLIDKQKEKLNRNLDSV